MESTTIKSKNEVNFLNEVYINRFCKYIFFNYIFKLLINNTIERLPKKWVSI